MSPSSAVNGKQELRRIKQLYDPHDSEASARRLLFALYPEWESSPGPLEFIRFKEGITNTLFKAEKKRPDFSRDQIDQDAVLLRAYGNGTEVLIDREREAYSHSMLASNGLAPTLLARFDNGLLYSFIQGDACEPLDLQASHVWPATARLLGRWHGSLPVTEDPNVKNSRESTYTSINQYLSGHPRINIWTVMRKWIDALPQRNVEEQKRKDSLLDEIEASAQMLGKIPGLSHGAYIQGHCDLLCGNVIIHPRSSKQELEQEEAEVSFIDYEYMTPAPAAFDIANHFSEWAGFECNYDWIPTRFQRRKFIEQYVQSFRKYSNTTRNNGITPDTNGHSNGTASQTDQDIEHLMTEIDKFRGIPGLYWGIWALVQAEISQIDFDYATYATVRLNEYWAWKADVEGCGKSAGDALSPKERRWAQEN